MLVVSYREFCKHGTRQIPIKNDDITTAIRKADSFYKRGYMDVKVIRVVETKTLYEPGGGPIELCENN